MLALIDACRFGEVRAQVVRVVLPREDAPARAVADRCQVPHIVLDPLASDYAARLLDTAKSDQWDVVCLAGYLRLLPKEVLAHFPNRVLNIHPALLPKFGGKGMYGMHVHEAVIASRDTESGVTLHLVNERYDEGEILVQLFCPVYPDDRPETLMARVMFLEHKAYVEGLRMVIDREFGT